VETDKYKTEAFTCCGTLSWKSGWEYLAVRMLMSIQVQMDILLYSYRTFGICGGGVGSGDAHFAAQESRHQ
jgi:hypothetical protein